jgi:hypothetical protein
VPIREQRPVYDNVPMANGRTVIAYRVLRGGVLLIKPEGFDGQKDMFYIFVHLLNGKTVLLNKVELSGTKKTEKTPSSKEMVLQFKDQWMEDDPTTLKDYEVTCEATLLEVLERGILEAMAQMSEPTDRFEAAFAQARNPNQPPPDLTLHPSCPHLTPYLIALTLSSNHPHPITLSPIIPSP